MMKKTVTMLLVLSMVTAANAALTLVAWDEEAGEWGDYPNSTLVITPGTTITIGVQDDELTSTGLYALNIDEGPGIFVEGSVQSPTSDVTALYEAEDYISLLVDVSTDGIVATSEFLCQGEGDVQLVIYGNDGEFADDLIIHQVPEPATMCLLGLGGLLLRRKK